MDEHLRKVGQRIRELREAAGLSQEDLAHAAGLSTKTINRLENGRNEGSRATFDSIAKVLKVERADIIGEPPAPLGLGGGNGGPSQLDRIEAMLVEVLSLLREEPEIPEVGIPGPDGLLRTLEDDRSKPESQPQPQKRRAAGRSRRRADT